MPCNLRAWKDHSKARDKGLGVTGLFGSLCDHMVPFTFSNMTRGEGYGPMSFLNVVWLSISHFFSLVSTFSRFKHFLMVMSEFIKSDYNRGNQVVSGYDLNCKIKSFLKVCHFFVKLLYWYLIAVTAT